MKRRTDGNSIALKEHWSWKAVIVSHRGLVRVAATVVFGDVLAPRKSIPGTR